MSFVDMIGCENTKHNTPKMLETVHCRVVVIYPDDDMADWEWWLSATAQHTRVSYQISLALEKIKIINLKYNFY